MDSVDDRIVHATLTLIGERGLAGITMVEIARRAGISRQTLYNHYPDVDRIVADAVRRHNGESAARVRSAVAVVDRPVERIEQLVRHVAQLSAEHHHSPPWGAGASPAIRDMLDDFDRVLADVIGDTLRRGMAEGEFRADLRPEIDATLVRHLLAGLSEAVAANPDRVGAITTAATRTVLAAITRPVTIR